MSNSQISKGNNYFNIFNRALKRLPSFLVKKFKIEKEFLSLCNEIEI